MASQESRKADSVKSKQRWEDRADQRGEKKRKENHLISSCCLTFLFGHLSHCHGCLSLLVFRDLETWENKLERFTSAFDCNESRGAIRKYTNTWKPPSTLITRFNRATSSTTEVYYPVINDAWVNITQIHTSSTFLGLNKKLETEKLRLLRLHPALDSLKHWWQMKVLHSWYRWSDSPQSWGN